MCRASHRAVGYRQRSAVSDRNHTLMGYAVSDRNKKYAVGDRKHDCPVCAVNERIDDLKRYTNGMERSTIAIAMCPECFIGKCEFSVTNVDLSTENVNFQLRIFKWK